MKKSLLLLALLPAFVMQAQNKINMAGLQLISDYKVQQMQAESRGGLTPEIIDATGGVVIPSHVLAAVILKPNAPTEAIEKLGGEVDMISDNIAIVRLPLDKANEIARLPEIISMSMGQRYHPLLNLAREAGLVNQVQTGTNLPQAYTGKGVLVSLMDSGLDPNHINFKSDNGNGTSRVKRVWKLTGSSSVYVDTYDTPEKIAEFTPDKSNETHGTHVLGIMAGSYNGEGQYLGTKYGGLAVVNGPLPFYGVAKDADIAVACGELYDACILKAAQLVSDYAKSEGKPVVFNMSLGGNIGPHDGSDAIGQYLKKMGNEGAIICISAGNEGSYDISLQHTFTATSQEVKTTLVSQNQDNSRAFLQEWLQIWSDDNSEFTSALAYYDITSKKLTQVYELKGNLEGAGVTVNSNTPNFSTAFTGSATLRSNIDPNNGRYTQSYYLNLMQKSDNLVPVVVVKGAPGVTVNIYTDDGMEMSSRNIADFVSGSPANSANDLACGENTLAIGSFNTRKTIYTYKGAELGVYPAGEVGDISNFSSYGSEINGKNIPTICAPGSTLYSSVSRYYVDGLSSAAKGNLQALATVANQQYYWQYMSGTSMASPFAAGTVALMLEAVPTLTFDQVREALVNSAVRDQAVTSATNQLQWGAGKIDAKAAVKYVLDKFSAIGDVFADDDKRLVITADRSLIDVTLAGEPQFNVRVVDLQGRTVASAKGTDGNAKVESSALTPGFYIVNVEGTSAHLSQKIYLR